MATIYNSDVTNGLQETCKIQINRDKVPNQLAEKIVPVISANPIRIANIVKKGLATGTIYTTPSDKDFFLTQIAIAGAVKDGNATVTDAVTITPKGSSAVEMCQLVLSSEAATTDSGTVVKNFNPPILLERNTAISALKGTDTTRQVIIGYTVED